MSNRPTIIITGSSGYLGSYVISYFSTLGFAVRAFQRTPPSSPLPGVEYYRFSFENVRDEGFEGADYLVHCAYETAESGKGDAGVNMTGTRHLVSLCRKYNIKPIFLSTLSAHSDAESVYGQTKLAMEGLFDPSRDLMLKSGFILGPGGLFGRICAAIKKHKIVPLVGGGAQLIQVIARDDLAQVIALGIQKNLSGNFAVAHPTPIRLSALYAEIAKIVGAHPIFVPLPLSITFWLLWLTEKIGLRLPITTENVLGLKHLKVFENAKDMGAFGIQTKDCAEALAGLKLGDF